MTESGCATHDGRGLCPAGVEGGNGERGVDGASRGEFAAEEHDAVYGERCAIGMSDGVDEAAETRRCFEGRSYPSPIPSSGEGVRDACDGQVGAERLPFGLAAGGGEGALNGVAELSEPVDGAVDSHPEDARRAAFGEDAGTAEPEFERRVPGGRRGDGVAEPRGVAGGPAADELEGEMRAAKIDPSHGVSPCAREACAHFGGDAGERGLRFQRERDSGEQAQAGVSHCGSP